MLLSILAVCVGEDARCPEVEDAVRVAVLSVACCVSLHCTVPQLWITCGRRVSSCDLKTFQAQFLAV